MPLFAPITKENFPVNDMNLNKVKPEAFATHFKSRLVLDDSMSDKMCIQDIKAGE
jgi:hypothetical protein